MDWTIDATTEAGYWLVRCGDVIDSRWMSVGAAQIRHGQLVTTRLSMTAAAGDTPPDGRPFYAVLCVDEYESADGRYFEHFEWETLPLSLWTLDDNGGGGHMGAEASGSIRTIERLSDNRRIFATGVLNTTDEGLQTTAQIESQTLRFVSVDPADYECDEEITKIGTDGWPIDGRLRFTKYVIGGATVLGNPAIRLAVVWLDGMDAPAELTMPLPDPVPPVQIPEIVDVDDDQDIIVIMASAAAEQTAALEHHTDYLGAADEVGIIADDPALRTLLASAVAARVEERACVLTDHCGGPALPPAEWFEQPQLSGPTPLTITPEGRIFGHVALWTVPHRGFLHYAWSEKIYAPRNTTGYREFLTGSTPVACCVEPRCGHERQTLRTGVLTVGTTHAGKRLSAADAQRFYENSGLQAADVLMFDDQWGPCISGALRPGMDDARVREVLGSTPSGDWRWINGNLELCAVLGVNTGGIPVIASSYVEEGEVRTLIAGWGAPPSEPDEALVASIGGSLRARGLPGAQRTPEGSGRPLRGRLEIDASQAAEVFERVLGPRLDHIEADLALLAPLMAVELEHDLAGLIRQASPARADALLAAVRSNGGR